MRMVARSCGPPASNKHAISARPEQGGAPRAHVDSPNTDSQEPMDPIDWRSAGVFSRRLHRQRGAPCDEWAVGGSPYRSISDPYRTTFTVSNRLSVAGTNCNMNRHANPRGQRVATIAVASTILFSSSLPYLFVGPLPIWIACGLVCVGLASLRRVLFTSIGALREVRWAIASWLILLLITLVLDALGYMERDVMAGPVLSLLTLMTFMGMISMASLASRRAGVAVLFSVAMLQGAISVLQFLGHAWAWEVSSSITSHLSFISKAGPGGISDMSLDAFYDIGRVRGTHIYVHIFNGIQATLAAFCLFDAFHSVGGTHTSRMGRIYAQSAASIASIGLLLSFSRSGVIALAITIVLLLLVNPRAKRIAGSLAMIVALLTALHVIGYVDAAQFARLLASSDDVNLYTRLEHTSHALQNFVNNPLVGASGFNGFRDLDMPIHSVPMRYLNDYGAVGLLLYLSVFIPVAALFLRGLRSRSSELARWSGSGFCVLAAIAADSWTHSSGFLRRDVFHAVILAFIIGSIIAVRKESAADSS